MDPGAPSTLAEKFSALLRYLGLAVDARGACGLARPLITLVIIRFSRLNQLIGRIASGRYVPRRRAAARKPARRAPPPLRLPRKLGWLVPLVPDANAFRCQLETLVQDPEMVALMAAAPAPMARALRPLCRMLGMRPPDIIAPPERPRALRPRRVRPPPSAKPPPIADLPGWLVDRRKPWSLRRTLGARGRR